MSSFKKYYNFPQWCLLFAYLFLIGLSILHYHHYDIASHNILATEPLQSASSNDLIQDYTGNCIVHHFSNNLLNYFYSSASICISTPPAYDYLKLPVCDIPAASIISSPSLRAPPVTA